MLVLPFLSSATSRGYSMTRSTKRKNIAIFSMPSINLYRCTQRRVQTCRKQLLAYCPHQCTHHRIKRTPSIGRAITSHAYPVCSLLQETGRMVCYPIPIPSWWRHPLRSRIPQRCPWQTSRCFRIPRWVCWRCCRCSCASLSEERTDAWTPRAIPERGCYG